MVCNQNNESMRLPEARLSAPCCKAKLWTGALAAALEIAGTCPGALAGIRPSRTRPGCSKKWESFPSQEREREKSDKRKT